MFRSPLAALLAALLFLGNLCAEEVGYVEDFAWAKDRAEALKQLIPGTRDYYYYHCLHLQNTQQFDKAEEVMQTWGTRHGTTGRLRMMLHRQALLTYGASPEQTLTYLRNQLNLRFDHQRERIGEKPNLPNSLDPQRISRKTLTEIAFRQANLQGFEHSALQWLIGQPLDRDNTRRLLSRLQRPDYADLVDVIHRDLSQRNSGGFGSLQIHAKLTLQQLDALLEKMPVLKNQTNYVNAYLAKLRPSDDADFQNNDEVQLAYLQRLRDYVSTLDSVHNSLKTHVLYHRLDYDYSHGVFDKERFLTYLRLPRNSAIINPKYLEAGNNRRYMANLSQTFDTTLLPPVGNDEPLVRNFFLHYFQEENTYDPYLPLVETNYLKRVFAETKAVNGLGNPEQWASLLSPTAYQALKDRIDLDFDAQNKKQFQVDEPVALDLHVKNVEKLIVKVFHINTVSHARGTLREVNTDIELDGLVANQEQTYDYDAPALRRIKRHFEFPELSEPGVYVIDFIGNGRSSRAVIRKGSIHTLVRATPIGQIVTVLTEDNEIAKDAFIWFGGAEYRPNEAGHILLPYSADRTGVKPMVVHHRGQAFVKKLTHLTEQYVLNAAMVVDREALQTRKKAELIIRPHLTINHVPATVELLEDVSLMITSTDLDGVSSQQFVDNLELVDNQETIYEFQVPARLSTIQFQLMGTVKLASKGNSPTSVSSSTHYTLNQILKTQQIADVHLAWIDNQYFVGLLGRTGEALADRAVHIELKHRDFTQSIHADLQTNADGNVQLGDLRDILWVKAKEQSGGTEKLWQLEGDFATVPSVIHGVAGEVVELPFVDPEATPETISLLETRGGRIVANRFDSLAVKNGLLQLRDLPPGDYSLLLKQQNKSVTVRITEAPRKTEFAVGSRRHLEIRPRPVSIASVTAADGKVKIEIANAGQDTRVHVLSTRFAPAFSAYQQFAKLGLPTPQYLTAGLRRSLFAEDRSIGDEYDYILRRQLADKFPGNMLERPSLLLNPWALRSTDTSAQDAKSGDAFGARPDAEAPPSPPPAADPSGRTVGELNDFSSLNWLSASAVLSNLTPDKNGQLEIEVEQLGGGQHLRVIALDHRGAVQRSVSLTEGDPKRRDLRLADGLDPEAHFIQQKQIAIIPKGEKFELRSIDSTRFEAYDSLGKVFNLYETLVKDPKFKEFRFILRWPQLKDDEKREKYSKFACHELNFFLMQKDPRFFNDVIAPYLASKKNKTFLDEFLVDAQLTAYLEPWHYGQLNLVERILIGRQLEDERAYVARHVDELVALIPPNPNRRSFLFNTAVNQSALATSPTSFSGKIPQEERLYVLGGGRNSSKENAAADAPVDAIANGVMAPPPGEPGAPQVAAARPAAAPQSNMPRGGQSKSAVQFSDKAGQGSGFNYRYAGKDRAETTALYRTLDKTKEWAENNYYHLPIEQQNADLVSANPFWLDYANHRGEAPFLSKHVAEASRNFTEAMLALAVLDLPWEAEEHQVKFEQDSMALSSRSAIIMFHEEIRAPQETDDDAAILVNQNLFRQNDRYRYENNQRLDKYVTDEFLTHTVYGCQIVVTNPTSAPQKLNVLTQIPVGSLPLGGGKSTNNFHIDLQPYNTQTIEFFFYFPQIGKYAMFPVHVSSEQTLLASADPRVLNVVESLSRVDRTSWEYISQNGQPDEVIRFLKDNNLQRLNLDKIAFRMGDVEFFESITGLLVRHHVYNRVLWSYSVKHNRPDRISEFLNHESGFVQQCGVYLESPLLAIDPVDRKTYQHLDYKPLVNARAHQLGSRRQILNDRVHQQYHQLLLIHSLHPELDDDDRMSAVYYLLLQDRVEDALEMFEQVNADRLATKLQYDYFDAYLGFYTGDIDRSADIAEKHIDHPVDRWQRAFVAIQSQIKEIKGGAAQVIDPESRDQQQTELADRAPSFDFEIDGGEVTLNHQNIEKATVNYYLMDIELLFSRNPFVQRYSGQFSHIQPNHSQPIDLKKAKRGVKKFALPKELNNANVLVEITAAGVTKTDAYYSNSLTVQLTERFGQLRVMDSKGEPLPKSYIKVFAQMKSGEVKFYKDGYTDLRGRFDYASLSTNELDNVQRFSVLIMSQQNGSLVKEALPPAR